MRSCRTLHLAVALFVLLLPYAVSAKRGGGRGSSKSSGNSSSSLSFDPINGAIFAISIIFAVLTGLQAIQAIVNIYKRATKKPPSIVNPEYSVGGAFRALLLFATSALTIYYSLNAAIWARLYNTKSNNHLVEASSLNAWRVMGYFTDIFLVAGILALLSHRKKILLGTSGPMHTVKMIVDAILIVILVALSLAYVAVGASAGASSIDSQKTLDRVNMVYMSFFLLVVLKITISAVILYFRAKRSPFYDHKVTFCTAFIISPIFIIYAVYPVVIRILMNKSVYSKLTPSQWTLVGLSITCITEFIIIAVCLRFGMPKEPKMDCEKAAAPPYKATYQ